VELAYVFQDVNSMTVQFTDESIGDITKWEWNFDANYNDSVDATYYEPTNPIKQYPAVNANYDVSLTVTYGDDCTDTITRSVYIRVVGCPV